MPKTDDLKEVHPVQRLIDTSSTVRAGAIAGKCSSTRIPIVGIMVVCAILLYGCGYTTKTPAVVRSECPSLDAGDYYFPESALDPSRPKIDRITRDWYSEYLRAMLEPSLSCDQGRDGYAYRFLWLRSFHHPIAVRVEKNGPSVTLTAVELDGTGGHEPGRIVRQVQRALSPAEQNEFLAKLRPVGFWQMPKNRNRFGLDGAQWLLEGAENGCYRVVERWSPAPGAYQDFCLLLLDLAGVVIPPLELY